ALAVHVHRDPVTRQALLRSQAFAGEHEPPGERRVAVRELVERSEMPLRDHERMKRRLRTNVLERDDLVILVELLGRNVAGDDLAEQAVRIVAHALTSPLERSLHYS